MPKINKIILLLSIFFCSTLRSENRSLFLGDSLKTKKDSLKKIALEEVSINTVRAERKLPVTETTLEQKEIEKNYTGQEMPVILARTPSFNWHSDGGNYTGYSYLRLRGIDQTRVNFTLNGVPLNEPEDQGAYFSNYPDFLNSVRSIQVQRGVGISTNGTASFAGSVNMESPSLFDSAYAEINGSYGSYNTYKASAETNTGILNKKMAFYARGSFTGSDGFRINSGTQGQSFFLSGAYLAKKGILKFTGFAGVSKNQMAYLAIADTTLKTNYRENFLSKDEKDKFTQSLAMLQYIVPIGKNSFLSTSAYYTFLEGGYNILFSPDLYNFSVRSNFYGGIINYQFQKNKLKINAGIHANDYSRSHYCFIQPNSDSLLYKNTGHKNEFSSFLKIAYELKKFTLFADMQYRIAQFNYIADKNSPLNIQTVSWQFINPKGGISYLLNNQHILYVSVGQTGREPTRNDLFAGYDNLDSLNYLEVGNLNRVKPETVMNVEVGVKLSFKKLKLDLNFYNMQFKNEIAAIGQLSYIGLPLRKNVESSYRRGLELNLIAEPLKGLIFSTQANLSDNLINSYTTDYDSITYKNIQPLLTPKIIFNQSVDYTFTNWVQAGINCMYLSEAFLDNSNSKNYTVPSSLIFNGSITFIVLKKHSLNFMVNNIANTKYYTSGYVQGTQPYYFAMATRNYFVTFKFKIH